MDAGGGVTGDAAFTVLGTVGQPDAGVMSDGAFTVAGGFWSAVSLVQRPGATEWPGTVVVWGNQVPPYVAPGTRFALPGDRAAHFLVESIAERRRQVEKGPRLDDSSWNHRERWVVIDPDSGQE